MGFPCLSIICFCREPRGFGFVQFVDPADAADAKYHVDGQILLGRELTVVFAEENRKKPTEMRARERRWALHPCLVYPCQLWIWSDSFWMDDLACNTQTCSCI